MINDAVKFGDRTRIR